MSLIWRKASRSWSSLSCSLRERDNLLSEQRQKATDAYGSRARHEARSAEQFDNTPVESDHAMWTMWTARSLTRLEKPKSGPGLAQLVSVDEQLWTRAVFVERASHRLASASGKGYL